MCHECSPYVNSSDDDTVMAEVRKYSKMIEEQIVQLLAIVNSFEDRYRSVGLVYHNTEFRAKQPRDDTRESLERLKAVFEISRVEEYNAIFAPHNTARERLLKLRADVQKAACSGTVAERYHRCFLELLPALCDLDTEANLITEDFSVLVEDASHIYDVSQAFGHARLLDAYMARQPGHGANDGRVLAAEMQEMWNTFRAWVWSFPETQRTVAEGHRSLQEVALSVLYSETAGITQ